MIISCVCFFVVVVLEWFLSECNGFENKIMYGASFVVWNVNVWVCYCFILFFNIIPRNWVVLNINKRMKNRLWFMDQLFLIVKVNISWLYIFIPGNSTSSVQLNYIDGIGFHWDILLRNTYWYYHSQRKQTTRYLLHYC